jgi:hypothetical protein
VRGLGRAQVVEYGGELVDPLAGNASYVLVERGGQWWLAAGQNTPVAERPA